MSIYVITGATGNTGKPIATGLLEKGHKVRIISRSEEKAKPFIDMGATFFKGDSSDVELMKRACEGAHANYAMVPFNMQAEDYFKFQMTHVNAIAEAVGSSNIRYAVTLSSVGAHLEEGAGVVQGLQKLEEKLNAINGLNTMHLRAAYFMENTLAQAGAVKQMGAMVSPVKGDLKLPMVATRDIANMALDYLLSLDFNGKNHEYVLGARDVSYNEIAEVYGKAIGKPGLQYKAVSYDDGAKAMMQMGMSESTASRMMEFVKVLNEGRVLEETKRTKQNTTPTSIEDFAGIFKSVYES